jgi:hypothetical protein
MQDVAEIKLKCAPYLVGAECTLCHEKCSCSSSLRTNVRLERRLLDVIEQLLFENNPHRCKAPST